MEAQITGASVVPTGLSSGARSEAGMTSKHVSKARWGICFKGRANPTDPLCHTHWQEEMGLGSKQEFPVHCSLGSTAPEQDPRDPKVWECLH